VPAIVDGTTHQHASDQLARNSALSFRNNTRNDYLLRCLLTCRTCGLAMFGVTTSGARGRRMHRYYICHGKDTVARDRTCRCPQARTKVEELDAAVWDHVKRLLNDPATLAAQFEGRAKQADAQDADAHAVGQKWEAQLRRLDREEQRLLDAYQGEAIDLDELKQRREQIRGRKQMITTQRDQEQRLRSERQTAKEVWADLTAFCERVRARLDEATLAERQRILQLLIDRVIVGEDTLEIRHVIPLGRLKTEPASPGPTDPAGSGGGEGSEPEGTPPVGLGARLRSDGVGEAGREIERALRPDRPDRTSGDAQLAFEARIVVDRVVVFGRLAIDQHGPQQDEVAESRVDQVAVNPHVAEAGLDGHRLVGDDPDGMPRGLIHLHREAHRGVHRPDPALLEPGHDGRADLVDLVACPVEFEVGHRPGRPAHRLARHAEHEAEQRLGPGVVPEDLLALRVESGASDFDEAGVGRAAIRSELA
jgi:Recombinase zinc beta ribbon domain